MTDYDNYETYVRSNEDDDQFFDRINKLRVRVVIIVRAETTLVALSSDNNLTWACDMCTDSFNY